MKLNKIILLNQFLTFLRYLKLFSYAISLFFNLIFFSCSSEDDSSLENPTEPNIQNPDNGLINPNPVTEPTLQTLDKKGIGMSYRQRTWSTRIGALKPFGPIHGIEITERLFPMELNLFPCFGEQLM